MSWLAPPLKSLMPKSRANESSRSLFAVLIVSCASLQSCVSYRFANRGVRPIAGMRSVAVESVFDTSGQVVDHGVVWQAFQEEIARSGLLRLENRKRADGLLRVHVVQAQLFNSGKAEVVDERRDQQDPELLSRQEPPVWNRFRSLGSAGEYARDEAYVLRLFVELYDLRTGKRVFARTFRNKFRHPAEQFSTRGQEQAIRNIEMRQHSTRLASNAVAKDVLDQILGRF